MYSPLQNIGTARPIPFYIWLHILCMPCLPDVHDLSTSSESYIQVVLQAVLKQVGLVNYADAVQNMIVG